MVQGMYGKSAAEFPGRIVCLSTEHVEICYALGAGDRVVGVPGTAERPPEARDKPRVGGFTSFRIDRIVQLEPELVLAFSDLQADVTAELLRAGLTVLCTNQRSVDDIFQTILMVGGALGLADRARGLVLDMRDEIRQVREYSSVWPDRPRVYFEEWPDPPIAGIRWVSEIIELAGGRDVFPELRARGVGARAGGGSRRGCPPRSADHPRLVVRQARGHRRHPRAPRLGSRQRGEGRRDPPSRRG